MKNYNAQSIDINPHSAENTNDSDMGELAKFLKEYHDKNTIMEPLPTPIVMPKIEQEPAIEKLKNDIFKQAGIVTFTSLPVLQDVPTVGFGFSYDNNIISQNSIHNIQDPYINTFKTTLSLYALL